MDVAVRTEIEVNESVLEERLAELEASRSRSPRVVSKLETLIRNGDDFETRPPPAELALKIGIHRGHSIAVTLNNRIDFFGQSVNTAARVQHLAGANEIVVTQDVAKRQESATPSTATKWLQRAAS